MDQKKSQKGIPLSFPEKKINTQTYIWAVATILGCLLSAFLLAALKLPDWVAVTILLTFLSILFWSLLAIIMVPRYCHIIADTQNIEIFIFRWKVREVPVSQVKLICSVEKDQYRNLCISLLSAEELAQRREEILKKGVFKKHELPFRKRSAGWQAQFAKEYLLHPKLRHCRFWKDSPVLWLYFSPTAAIYLKERYPHIPYLNACEYIFEKYTDAEPDVIPYTFDHRLAVAPEGIYICRNKQKQLFMPVEHIKTIARVDAYSFRGRGQIGHSIFLMVSTLSTEELARRGRLTGQSNWKMELTKDLTCEEEVSAVAYMDYKMQLGFYFKNQELLPMHYTLKNEQELRRMYPHARWLDISHRWKQ